MNSGEKILAPKDVAGGFKGKFSRTRALGCEAARPCVSQEVKPRKDFSLIENFCAHPKRKWKEILPVLCRRQAASRQGGDTASKAIGIFQFSEIFGKMSSTWLYKY